jgi:hypothetical protein
MLLQLTSLNYKSWQGADTLLVRLLSGKGKKSFITFPTGFKINCHVTFNPDLSTVEKGSDEPERVAFSQQLQQQL